MGHSGTEFEARPRGSVFHGDFYLRAEVISNVVVQINVTVWTTKVFLSFTSVYETAGTECCRVHLQIEWPRREADPS